MTALVLAGGTIYALPYLRQGFHKAMLEAFGVSNTELGFLNSAFGVFALACYFPGGWVADRFNPKRLLIVSLVATSLGGFVFATLPPYPVVLALHAFWGVSSILTFWAALIRATRGWGGAEEQGKAFGYLDGGRGVVEGALGVVTVVVFGLFSSSVAGLRGVVLTFSIAGLLAAVGVWAFIPDSPASTDETRHKKALGAEQIKAVLSMPVVWLQAVVIFCAYCGYWGTFDLGLFATDGFGESEVYGASLATFRQWCRPVAAILAGFAADRIGASRMVGVGFVALAAGYIGLAVVPTRPDLLWILWVDTAVVALAVFALRGIYYALLQEGGVPVLLTGTAVGIVSVVGYTPDIIMGPLVGYLLDAHPGASGHRLYFAGLAAVSGVGLAATWAIARLGQRQHTDEAVPLLAD